MAILQTIGNSLTKFYNNRAYWKVKLTNDKWISETDLSFDLLRGIRERDWALDLVATDDTKKIKELWLICPANQISPLGNTARLPIVVPGTAFQFKVRRRCLGESEITAQVIGRVDDLGTGLCTAFIWDNEIKAMMEPFKTHIDNFEAWRPGIVGLGALSKEILGIVV